MRIEDEPWMELMRGPTGLIEADWNHAKWMLPNDTARAVMGRLVDQIVRQTKWIAEAREELVGETARVRDIGIVMQKAGLRSYTDKEGRIYVADKETSRDG